MRELLAGVARDLEVMRRVPDHLRFLDLPVADDLVQALCMAVVLTKLNVGQGAFGSTTIIRPASAAKCRERWPMERDHLPPKQVVMLFEMEHLLEPG